MARPDWPATIMDFQERFASEAACLDYLAASRWPDGFVCPACGGRRAWVLERRHLWECGDCGQQTSVTAGTVMHGTRTPLRVWFWAAYLVATHHPGISAKQLQRQLGLSRYETAWLILQKLRRAMVAPEREPLKREVEIDEFFLGGLEEGQRGGRQRGKKALCGIAIEVRGQGSGRLRLAVLADASGRSLGAFAKSTTARGAIVHTDGWTGYLGLSKLGYDHRRRSQLAEPGEQLLPRAHRAVSQPQSLAARHPSRRRQSPSPGLPRRVRLPPQPPPHTNGRLPDPARTRRSAPADDLRGDHRPPPGRSLSEPDTHLWANGNP
jgi:hypothetical protein